MHNFTTVNTEDITEPLRVKNIEQFKTKVKFTLGSKKKKPTNEWSTFWAVEPQLRMPSLKLQYDIWSTYSS